MIHSQAHGSDIKAAARNYAAGNLEIIIFRNGLKQRISGVFKRSLVGV
jgi:hypothetical protein